MPNPYDRLGQSGRDRDRAARQEFELPPTGPEAPHETVLTPADLDRTFGIGELRIPSAAAERREHDTWRK